MSLLVYNVNTLSLSVKVLRDASQFGINTHIVRDAGRTQIAPGSETVLCIGPGTVSSLLLLIIIIIK